MTYLKALLLAALFTLTEAHAVVSTPYLFAVTSPNGSLKFLETSSTEKRNIFLKGNYLYNWDKDFTSSNIWNPPFFTASIETKILKNVQPPSIQFAEGNSFPGVPRTIQSILVYEPVHVAARAAIAIDLPPLPAFTSSRSAATLKFKPARIKNLKGLQIIASYQEGGLILVPNRITYKKQEIVVPKTERKPVEETKIVDAEVDEEGNPIYEYAVVEQVEDPAPIDPYTKNCESFKRSFYRVYRLGSSAQPPTDESKLGVIAGEIATEETLKSKCYNRSTGSFRLASGVTQPEVQLANFNYLTLRNISNGNFRTSRNARGQLVQLGYHTNSKSPQKFDLTFYEDGNPEGNDAPSQITTQSGQEVLRVNQSVESNETFAFVKTKDLTQLKRQDWRNIFNSPYITHQFLEFYDVYTYQPREKVDYYYTQYEETDGYPGVGETVTRNQLHYYPRVVAKPDQFGDFLGTFSISSEDTKFIE